MQPTHTSKEPTRRSRFFARLGQVVVNHPWRVLAVWAVVALAVTLGAKNIDPASVQSTSEASFLPAENESAKAQKVSEQAFPQPKGATASIVVTRVDRQPLTSADSRRVEQLVTGLNAARPPNVASVTTDDSSLSPNRKVQLGSVQFTKLAADKSVPEGIVALRDKSEKLLAGSGLTARYTGEAAYKQDAKAADSLSHVLMIVAIFLLLLVIFRSPFVPVINIAAMFGATAIANGLVLIAAKSFGVEIDDTVTGLLPVVIFGIGTDYVVFLLFRYRERLRKGDDPKQAMATSIARVGEAITSSAFAVIVSLSALLLSSLGSFRVLGPALAGTVLLMLIAGLTLIPAMMVITGRKLFWPSKAWQAERTGRAAGRMATAVTRGPGRTAVVAVAVMAALAVGAFGFQANYDQDNAPKGTESAQADREIKAGFPVGVLHPTQVIVKSSDGSRLGNSQLSSLRDRLSHTEGVGAVQATQFNRDGSVAMIDVLLKDKPFSGAAMDDVRDSVIPAAHEATPSGTSVRVGGDTSTYVDLSAAVERDQKVIFPVAALLIGLILMALLGSVVAPLFLMASVTLGFVATLGASVLLFQGAAGEPGLGFSIPIVVYLFVASMGSDYAIFMISRVREEMEEGRTPRRAAAEAVRHAGPAVAAAGVVLAGTFAALIPTAGLAQIGFAVAIGVLLSAFVMAWALVPSLTALLGRRAFWPGKTSRAGAELRARREVASVL
jgi:RND superfamily putative drug exporter